LQNLVIASEPLPFWQEHRRDCHFGRQATAIVAVTPPRLPFWQAQQILCQTQLPFWQYSNFHAEGDWYAVCT
jgi:hypothetical protein